RRSAAGRRTSPTARPPCRPRRPRRSRGARSSIVADDRLGLLAEELLDVVRAEAALAGRAGALPAAEALDARPGTGRGARAAVHVHDAGLDGVQEPIDLVLVAA